MRPAVRPPICPQRADPPSRAPGVPRRSTIGAKYEHTQIQGILKSLAENPAETAKKIETQLVLGRVEVAESRLAEMCVMCVTVPQCAGWTPPRLLTSRLHLHGGDSGEADKGERYTKGRGGGPQPPAQSAHSCRVGRG